MKITFGTTLYGSLHQQDGSFVATKFWHLMYLPLVPLGSFALPQAPRFSDSYFSGQAISLHFGSMLTAYFKVWGFLFALALCAGALWGDLEWPISGGVLAIGVFLLFLVIFSWMRLGKAPHARSGLVKAFAVASGVAAFVGIFALLAGIGEQYRLAAYRTGNPLGIAIELPGSGSALPTSCAECQNLPPSAQTPEAAQTCMSLCMAEMRR